MKESRLLERMDMFAVKDIQKALHDAGVSLSSSAIYQWRYRRSIPSAYRRIIEQTINKLDKANEKTTA